MVEALDETIKMKRSGNISQILKQQEQQSLVEQKANAARKHFKSLTTFINAYHGKLTHNSSNS